MKKYILPALILPVTLLISCGPAKKVKGKNEYLSVKDTLYLPFDTSTVISMLNMEESLLPGRNIMDSLDTLELVYMAYACDCPDWVTPGMDDLPSSDTAVMNKSYYIEHGSNKLNERFFVAGNRVRFFGRLRSEQDWPQDAVFTSMNPSKGKVFTYYGFEVLRPATVWGPYYHTGDSVTEYGRSMELIAATKLILR